jgi:hypothetical protein
MDLKEIRDDIAAFADDEESVLFDRGIIVFQRDRETCELKLVESANGLEVEYSGRILPYRKFLAEELGRMSIVASALIEKRRDVEPYIDTQSTIVDFMGKGGKKQSALHALWEECQSKSPGETKLLFLTAGAGYGKTALLRRLTRRFANSYLEGKTDRLLFHIDTQGRSFVRLEEAVARDLGHLRIFGLFYPGVLRLVRRGLMALAIDGFDELLAEIGVGEAYSGLGALLRQLQGDGVVIASARSAYFEAENYTAQTRLLTSSPDSHVSVSQMKLEPWGRQESIELFRQYKDESGAQIANPESLYDQLSTSLGENHPVLQRPFLVYKMASLIAPNAGAAAELTADLGQSAIEVVPKVVHALLKREVEEKWRDQSGQPYLTVEQHIQLLSAIADEMWMQGKNSLQVEVVQLICEAVLDDLDIPTSWRVQIIQRIKAHALLPVSNSGGLSFDHEEFLNYFLAMRLVEILKRRDSFSLQRFCEQYPLPASACLWAANIENWSYDSSREIVAWFSETCQREVRSTYLRQNLGLITARIAGRFVDVIDSGGFSMESMYFDGDSWNESMLAHAIFTKCTFVNVDLSGASWTNCRFVGCNVDGLILDSKSCLQGTSFDSSCLVTGVLKRTSDDDTRMKSYVPDECRALLEREGAIFEIDEPNAQILKPIPEQDRKMLDTFFRIFSRNTGANENVLRLKLGARFTNFRKNLLPLMLRHNVVREVAYDGSGQQQRFELCFPIESILRAEDPLAIAPRNLKEFWESIRN